MRITFNHIFTIVSIAMLSIAFTNCTGGIEARVNATLTAERAYRLAVEEGIQATLNSVQTSVPPMETSIQPTMTSGNPAMQIATSTPKPPAATSVEPPIMISSPANDVDVPRLIEVSGNVDKSALGGNFLNVIVATQAGELFVQTIPNVLNDGTWSSAPVHIGSAEFGVGEKFTICAVIADRQLPVDSKPFYKYPDGTKACIEVTRVE